MTQPTPGAPDLVENPGNSLPSLAPIQNQTVNELSLLSLIAAATDPDPVRVTDDGSPPLSATRTFQIIVEGLASLEITGIEVVSAGIVAITWSSEPGSVYHLESTDHLMIFDWTRIDEYTATGHTITATQIIQGTTQRYYRVLRAP